MRVADTVRLDRPAGTISDIEEYILSRASGKTVLTVGAAGGVQQYLPDRAHLWMHARLGSVAKEVLGIDIDTESVAHAAAHGYEIHEANCESMNLGRKFDLILMSDVLEHLDRPSQAIMNLVNHLEPSGELLITTPNATFIGNVIKATLRRPISIFWDDMAIYMPEHIQALCDRHGFELSEVAFFSFTDRRSLYLRLKSSLAKTFTMLSPRFHSTFLAIVKPK